MYVVTTGVNKAYIPRMMVLWYSLRQFNPDVHMHVLCFDQEASDWFAKAGLDGVTTESLDWMELTKPELPIARESRQLIEYFFMLKPYAVESAMDKFPEAEFVAYSDSDIMFFDDFKLIADAMGDANVGLAGHRFPLGHQDLERFGHYNAGFYVLRNNAAGRAFNEHHRRMCLVTTADTPSEHVFCDQKFLNRLSQIGDKVVELDHAGIDLAPWNLLTHNLQVRDDKVYADSLPLVCYHYHGMKESEPGNVVPGYHMFNPPNTQLLDDYIYRPHLELLLQMKQLVFPEDTSGRILNANIRPSLD